MNFVEGDSKIKDDCLSVSLKIKLEKKQKVEMRTSTVTIDYKILSRKFL